MGMLETSTTTARRIPNRALLQPSPGGVLPTSKGSTGKLTDHEAVVSICALSTNNQADDQNLQLENIQTLDFHDSTTFGSNAANNASINRQTGKKSSNWHQAKLFQPPGPPCALIWNQKVPAQASRTLTHITHARKRISTLIREQQTSNKAKPTVSSSSFHKHPSNRPKAIDKTTRRPGWQSHRERMPARLHTTTRCRQQTGWRWRQSDLQSSWTSAMHQAHADRQLLRG